MIKALNSGSLILRIMDLMFQDILLIKILDQLQ